MKYLAQLFTGEPVMLNDEIGIHQLTMGEIINSPELDSLIEPFTVDLETIDIGLVERPEWTYDLFFLTKDDGSYVLEKNGTSYLVLVMLALKTMCKVEEIELLYNNSILVGGGFVLGKNNFDKVADIIKELYCRETVVSEKPPSSPRQYQIWKETMDGRKKKAKKDSPTLYDIINIVIHYDYNIRYKQVMELTLWQLFNSLEHLNSMDSYREYLMYATNTMAKIKERDKIKHWTITSRIFKKKD